MGQHTWGVKSLTALKEERAVYKLAEDFEAGNLSDIELANFDYEAVHAKIYEYEFSNDNDTDFNDMFRTGKRNADGTYTDDIITSKEHCKKWLEENIALVHNLNADYLAKFWDEYPDGAIYFG